MRKLSLKRGEAPVERGGFSLLEMMIVITLIAIIAGIMLPNLEGLRLVRTIARVKGDLAALQNAIESYNVHHNNNYPASLDVLTTAVPTIISFIGADPFSPSGQQYSYARSDNGMYYVLYSVGPQQNGAAAVNDDGVVSQTNGESCIFFSNAAEDK